VDARYALELLEEVNREIWKDPIRQFDISLDTARAAGIFAARHVMAVPQLIAGGAVRKVKIGHYTILTQNPNKTSSWAKAAREKGAKVLWLLDDALSSNNFIYMLFTDKEGSTFYQADEATRQWKAVTLDGENHIS